MAITKKTVTTGNALEDGQIEVKAEVVILEDGIEISRSKPHRHLVDVGDDVSGEDQVIQDMASGLHTPARVAARAITKAAVLMTTFN